MYKPEKKVTNLNEKKKKMEENTAEIKKDKANSARTLKSLEKKAKIVN